MFCLTTQLSQLAVLACGVFAICQTNQTTASIDWITSVTLATQGCEKLRQTSLT